MSEVLVVWHVLVASFLPGVYRLPRREWNTNVNQHMQYIHIAALHVFHCYARIRDWYIALCCDTRVLYMYQQTPQAQYYSSACLCRHSLYMYMYTCTSPWKMRIWKNVSSRRILSGVILVESSRTGFRERKGKVRKKKKSCGGHVQQQYK